MTPLWHILAAIWRSERQALLRGIALAVVVLSMGVALLGLSGWFIIAAGAAGMAGLGAVFDVFRPSAGVRFLALGRTAARYGERLLTHDATLRALAAIRVRLLTNLSAAPFAVISRFRSAQILNRLTADVDALDGIALRLVIPLIAGTVTLAGAWALLSWLVHPLAASWAVAALFTGSAVTLAWAARQTSRASRLAEASAQAFRVRLIDHLRGRALLSFSDAHAASERHVLDADARARRAAFDVAAIERRAGTILSIVATVAAAGVLLIGAELVRNGVLSPALAALGFLATLAMAEIVAPIRRGVTELGRMRDAARRVDRWQTPADISVTPAKPAPSNRGGIVADSISVAPRPDVPPVIDRLSFAVAPGETLALTGRSGSGKTSVLTVISGLVRPSAGQVRLAEALVEDWPEADLRRLLGYLPQRSVLVGGSVAENLSLAAPTATDSDLWEVLEHVELQPVIERMGGLDALLGEGGMGLSGGESRRLALARVLIRSPRILLLDEPTEGLDRETASAVLGGIRRICPDAAILVAVHRDVERNWADRSLDLG